MRWWRREKKTHTHKHSCTGIRTDIYVHVHISRLSSHEQDKILFMTSYLARSWESSCCEGLCVLCALCFGARMRVRDVSILIGVIYLTNRFVKLYMFAEAMRQRALVRLYELLLSWRCCCRWRQSRARTWFAALCRCRCRRVSRAVVKCMLYHLGITWFLIVCTTQTTTQHRRWRQQRFTTTTKKHSVGPSNGDKLTAPQMKRCTKCHYYYTQFHSSLSVSESQRKWLHASNFTRRKSSHIITLLL